MKIGPLREVMSSIRLGSRKRLSGSRLSVIGSGSLTSRPSSAPRTMSTAAAWSAMAGPQASAASPQIQLPSAMPPNVAIW